MSGIFLSRGGYGKIGHSQLKGDDDGWLLMAATFVFQKHISTKISLLVNALFISTTPHDPLSLIMRCAEGVHATCIALS